MVIKEILLQFLNKNSFESGVKSDIMSNQQLAEELHKPIIKKFKKRNVYSLFKHNICVADQADMQIICKYNKGLLFLLCY